MKYIFTWIGKENNILIAAICIIVSASTVMHCLHDSNVACL